MAAQTVRRGFDAHNRTNSTTSSASYPAAPPSSTLTNPDMILPDYERSDSPEGRSQSPMMLWNNGQFTDLQYHLTPQNNFVAGPTTPTTPIIYGNGTMLSDIGEVTEVESVAGKHYADFSDHSDDDAAVPTSTKLGESRIKRRSQILGRGRSSSMDSVSTVRSNGRAAHVTELDDSASVDDTSFQGDDEESMASSYAEGTTPKDYSSRIRSIYQGPAEARYSSNTLSQRAEEILANAKMRLMKMEGNLSRARSSLSQSSDGSTPSPLSRPPTALMREPTITPSSFLHSRNLSETGVSPNARTPAFPQRSASALGAAGGYRQPLTSSRSADTLGARPAVRPSRNIPEPQTEQLAEGENGVGMDSRRSSAQLTNMLSPTFGTALGSEKGLTRSVSVAQMRDIKGQMADLKGKISSLKQQARVDSLKRRSFQSLRAPSPFTHARWEQGYSSPDTDTSPLTTPLTTPILGETMAAALEDAVNASEAKGAEPEDEAARLTKISSHEETLMKLESSTPVEGLGIMQPPQEPLEQQFEEPLESPIADYDDDDDDMQTENGDVAQDEWEEAQQGLEDENDQVSVITDTESESGESLYHETRQTPISHEDREDAFDYEHFFLHSAMGTLSRDRSNSVSSEDSVETTKGLARSHGRRPSVDTIDSFESFATANEGGTSRNSPASMSDEDQTKETIVVTRSNGSDGPPTGRSWQPTESKVGRSQSANNFHTQSRRGSVVHRPASSAAVPHHRPSISSLGSTGTNRSFPLVNKTRMNGGILTPGGSPDHELKQVSQALMNDTTTRAGEDDVTAGQITIQMLAKEDQIQVERLVATLGKVVLGLSEALSASTESRTYRRRMEAARRMLEGLDD